MRIGNALAQIRIGENSGKTRVTVAQFPTARTSSWSLRPCHRFNNFRLEEYTRWAKTRHAKIDNENKKNRWILLTIGQSQQAAWENAISANLLPISKSKDRTININVWCSSGYPGVLQKVGGLGFNLQLIRHTLPTQIVDTHTPGHGWKVQNEVVVKLPPSSTQRPEKMVQKRNVEPNDGV